MVFHDKLNLSRATFVSICKREEQWLNSRVKCSKTSVKRSLSKRPKIGFQARLSLNEGQKYCRMLQREQSAILSTFIKLPFVIKIFILSIFEWLFYTGCTVQDLRWRVQWFEPHRRHYAVFLSKTLY